MNDLDRRKTLARVVLDDLAEIDPAALRLLAEGLAFADAPLRELSKPLGYYATDLEDGDGDDAPLAVLSLSRVLRIIIEHPDDGELLSRIRSLDGLPWRPIATALSALQTERAGADHE